MFAHSLHCKLCLLEIKELKLRLIPWGTTESIMKREIWKTALDLIIATEVNFMLIAKNLIRRKISCHIRVRNKNMESYRWKKLFLTLSDRQGHLKVKSKVTIKYPEKIAYLQRSLKFDFWWVILPFWSFCQTLYKTLKTNTW